ncbi:MAG TPA: hypothetical protein VFG74_16990, partial [Miltoncostaeaceae bacterium]|nr:hypothetical protein [Miltoncostaeaceae bacterium]
RTVIVNLSVDGDLPGAGGQAKVVLLAHGPEGWSGGVDLYRGADAAVSGRSAGLRVGRQRIAFRGGRYRVAAALRDGTLAVRAELTPAAEPAMIWHDTPVGSGYVNWLIVPDLAVGGTARLPGWRGPLDGWRGYHDHNWGRWWWGEDFGWQWGVAREPAGADGGPGLTVVYDRTSDRGGTIAKEHTLSLWSGADLVRVFARGELRARMAGRFAGGPVRRVPGVMGLLAQGSASAVPRAVEVEAADDGARLALRFVPASVVEVVVPGELGAGFVRLAEAVGEMAVEGRVAGRDVAFRSRAVFEFMGA